MTQSSTLWNQSYSRELVMDHQEGINWISADGCLENIKESHFVEYSDPNQVTMEDPLGNNFYDCTDLDDNFHSYLIKGLLGGDTEGVSGSSNLNEISSVNSIRDQSNVDASVNHNIDSICTSIDHRIDNIGIGIGALGVNLGGGGGICVGLGVEAGVGQEGRKEADAFETMDCAYTTNPHSYPLTGAVEDTALGNQNACYGMPITSSHMDTTNGSSPLLKSSSPTTTLRAVPSASASASASASSSSPSSSSSSSSSSMQSLQIDSGLTPISLPPRAIPPINISQSLMTPTTTSSSSVSPITFSPNSIQQSSKLMDFDVSYQVESNQKKVRMEPEEGIRMDIFDDSIVGSEAKFNDYQIVDLDSSKGRRWSNNSTTSTISSSFSMNTNDGRPISHMNDIACNESIGILSHDFQQDKFRSAEDLESQKTSMVDHSYEMGVIEDDNYALGGQVEGEFYMNSENYLTEEEKLKLRRRGRRRRPGEIEAWKTIIPRTTVDEAEHFVQTSQYRMRHVYRDPRAVSFVYRCVQHVDCQYEMRIYLISHETCYVQHRGYHTEEKQKYKRPGLPQHTLPLIDELIRKGLPPKSVIDHAIQIYPEVADQSNISVLYRQITNRQQYIRKRQRNYV